MATTHRDPNRPRFLLLLILPLLVAALLLWKIGPEAAPPRRKAPFRVIVLGFDGMDADLTEQYMAAGKLPNLQKLALDNDRLGLKGYSALASTNPSESPVSWSSMITGQNPGKTNVYDFLRRYPETYDIDNAMVDTRDQAKFIAGTVPIKKPNFRNFREGDPLWALTTQAGYRTIVLEAPVSFPPDKIPGGMLLCGLGVADLRGTQGTYTYYTTDERALASDTVTTEFGGKLKKVFAQADGTIPMDLIGPPNRVGNPGGKRSDRPVDLTLPMVLKPRVPATNAPRAGSAPPPGLRLEVTRPDSSVAAADLTPGVWSDFLEVHFEVTPVVKVHGIFKALLTHYDTSDPKFPKMGLYISPINFSPKSPPLAISYPAGWTGELAEEYGNFKTVGWPSETWGVNDGVLTEQAFMDDIDQTQEKWEEMLFGTLAKGDWDVLFAVSQQTDHIGHMFYRFLDPKHPAHDAERAKDPFYSEALLRSYQRADQVVGKVMAEYLKDDRTILLVVSDHGFNSFRRAVNINRWLINHGFMALKLPEGQGTETLNTAQLFAGDEFFKDVDWTKTKAYAMGLGQIYLNLKDREGQGIVEPGAEAEQVKRDITAGLMQMKDPKDGSPIMRSVFDGAKIYHGQAMAQAPDLVTGFHDGFRVSWQTALGGAPAEEVEDNNLPWSGDHCSFDPEITMGVCFTNWRIDKADPSVLDIAPSVLKALGIPQPAEMDGRPLFETLPSREG